MHAFRTLREDNDFADVTLACEDGKQVEAHKVILANSSPFFQNLLKRNKHNHPLIYMRGVKSDDLLAIIDFLYCGETNVYQENLDSFLAIAEELQLKGLTGKADDDDVQKETIKNPYVQKKVVPANKKEPNVEESTAHFTPNGQILNSESQIIGKTVALKSIFSGDFQELAERSNSMMEKTSGKNSHGQQLYRCEGCGKEDIRTNIKRHIEAQHLEGVYIPCDLCEKTFRSINSLSNHISGKQKDRNL